MGRKQSDEAKRKLSIAHTGKHHSEETKRKIAEGNRKHMAIPEVKEKMRAVNSRPGRKYTTEGYEKKHTLAFREKMRQMNVKDNQDLEATVIVHYKYRMWRVEVFSRDDKTCQHCFTKTGPMEAHHKIPILSIIRQNESRIKAGDFDIPLLYDKENGITLCRNCHMIEHGKKLRINKQSLHEIINSLRMELAEKDRIIKELRGLRVAPNHGAQHTIRGVTL